MMRSFCLWVWVWGCSGIGACWHGGVRGVGIIYFLDWIGSIHGAERSPLDRRFMNLFVFITPFVPCCCEWLFRPIKMAVWQYRVIPTRFFPYAPRSGSMKPIPTRAPRPPPFLLGNGANSSQVLQQGPWASACSGILRDQDSSAARSRVQRKGSHKSRKPGSDLQSGHEIQGIKHEKYQVLAVLRRVLEYEFYRLNHILAGSMQFLLDFSPRRTAGDPSPTILRRRHQHNNKKQITIAIPRDRHSRESAAFSLDHLRTKETCNRRHTKHKVTQHPTQ